MFVFVLRLFYVLAGNREILDKFYGFSAQEGAVKKNRYDYGGGDESSIDLKDISLQQTSLLGTIVPLQKERGLQLNG